MSAKHKILNAAACVVDRAGAAHLTIDAVAAEARLSKGGVLYHFPTKRAMLEGMLDHVLTRIEERLARHQAVLDDGPNRLSRAFVLAEQEQDDQERAMSLALLAAAAEDPSLLEPARCAVRRWFDTARREGEAGVLVLLAVEGMRFLDNLNLLPLRGVERADLQRSLLRMAEGELP